MLWDKTCRLVESFEAEQGTLNRVLRKSAVFVMDRSDSTALCEELVKLPHAEREEMLRTFSLPYPETAVDIDDWALAVFWDFSASEDGSDTLWTVKVLLVMEDDDSHGPVCAYVDVVVRHRAGHEPELGLAYVAVIDGKRLLTQHTEGATKWAALTNGMAKPTLDVLGRHLYSLQALMLPSRFIVEVTPKRVRRPDAPKIPRVGDRPLYTVMRHSEIAKRYLPNAGMQVGTGQTRAPHPRRAHRRVLRAEKWGNSRGKVITIPAMWIGPSVTTIKGRTYRVVLDR